MKRIKLLICILSVLIFALLLGGNKQVSYANENESETIDVFLLAGQSNMVGFSRLSLLDDKYKKEYPNVLMYNGGDCIGTERNKLTYVHPGQGTQSAMALLGSEAFGPELGMASVLSSNNKKIAFIKFAYGGTAIFQHPELNNTQSNKDNWHGPWDGATSGNLYKNFLSTVRNGLNALISMGYNPVVRGLAYMQGETDGEIQFNNDVYHAADAYEHNLTELFNAFREEVSIINDQDLSEMPIVFGEIFEYSKAVIEVRKIVEAQNNVGKLDNNYLIETSDLLITSKVDDWHWNGNWMYWLGVRFGEKLYETVYGLNTIEYSDGYEE